MFELRDIVILRSCLYTEDYSYYYSVRRKEKEIDHNINIREIYWSKNIG